MNRIENATVCNVNIANIAEQSLHLGKEINVGVNIDFVLLAYI